jgi:peptide/nickel transport system substrate-binding protein
MRTGKIDMVLLGMTNPTLQQAQTLSETNPDIVVVWKPQAQGGGGLSFKWGAEPFDDIMVRKAMQLAIDAKQITTTLSLGMGEEWIPSGLGSQLLGEDWVVPYEKWSAELKAEYEYNPEKAKQMLADAGYPDGFKTNIITSSNQSMETLEMAKSFLMDVGIDMEIKVMDRTTYQRFRMERQHDQMDFGGTGGSGAGLPSLANLVYANAAQNTNGINDPHYEELAAQFDAAATMEEVQRIFKEADQYYLEQHWVVQTGSATVAAQAWQPWVKGYLGEVAQAEWTFPWYSFMWIDQDLKGSLGY